MIGIKWLKKPHPFIYSYTSIILPGIIASFLLLSFMPFGLDQLAFQKRFAIAMLIGVITSLSVVLVVNILKWLTEPDALENNWSVGKELGLILSIVLTITSFIFVLFMALGLSDEAILPLLQQTIFKTLLISILPIIILILTEQYYAYKKQLRISEALNQELSKNLKQQIKNQHQAIHKVLFKTEHGKPVIRLEKHEIAFLKSDGNYVEVYYSDSSGQIKKALIRNKLKALIEQLPAKGFFHCHKSYVVNENWIHAVRGNARNYELSLKFVETWIPVSRSKVDAMKMVLTA